MNELFELGNTAPVKRRKSSAPAATGLASLVTLAHSSRKNMADLKEANLQAQTEACRRMFAAKLLRHVVDLYEDARKNRRVPSECAAMSARWVAETGTEDEVASFEWICRLLDLSPGKIRVKIARNCEEYRRVAAETKGKKVLPNIVVHAKAMAKEDALLAGNG